MISDLNAEGLEKPHWQHNWIVFIHFGPIKIIH